MTDTIGVHSRSRWQSRHRAAAAAALALVAALSLGVAAWRERSQGASIATAATLSSALLDSAEGERLATQFESLGGTRLTRWTGPAVFMTGAWRSQGEVGPDCQIQLAVHTGQDWQLFGWTSDHRITNGTINAWGGIVAESSSLGDYRTTVTLAPSQSGQFMLVWQTPGRSVDLRIVKARVVRACGEHKRPGMFDVRITA
jgi:hypothetical protein